VAQAAVHSLIIHSFNLFYSDSTPPNYCTSFIEEKIAIGQNMEKDIHSI
jgi:hypothetical protein